MQPLERRGVAAVGRADHEGAVGGVDDGQRGQVRVHERSGPAGHEPEHCLVLAALDDGLGHLEQGAQPVVDVLPLGDVTRDLGEALDLAALVVERRDDRAGPEARAVAPNPPALVLVPAGGPGLLDLAR